MRKRTRYSRDNDEIDLSSSNSQRSRRLTASQIVADEDESGSEYEEVSHPPRRSQRLSNSNQQQRSDDSSDEYEPPVATQNREIDLNLMVKNTIRLAICSQASRQPLSRREIIQKAFLPNTPRQYFPKVIDLANRKLNSTFGMKLCEIVSNDLSKFMEVSQLRKTNTARASTTKYWILRNELPDEYQDFTVPRSPLENAQTAFLFITLSLIALSQGSLLESDLKAYLQSLLVLTHIPLRHDLDRTLVQLVRNGYLDRTKNDTHNQYNYLIGARASAEIGKSGMIKFISYFVPANEVEGIVAMNDDNSTQSQDDSQSEEEENDEEQSGNS
ncbi:Smc5-6 complex non-SMC subunit Nse3 [Schizosaccharomyces japonicus yFS275]|uniref:Smc5-6 complex non-SMC subunit Nse3 n=1 Tax=Schizosaccharomyces japonicus (strain yFS275 / FY16936) TaxID=402676 RepID=B6K4Y7_SCHJY|nr:Smc5-6 complex non-SMC subunit Nse3 [Schizosaccharomyces japonicus yFS275]EEB08544.1 Smc5-6 complex non-SMC subunit Nse3 [Schizosaccharomyces japonicus yFS275]